MAKIAKLNPKIMDLQSARDEFLLFKSASGLAPRTLEDYTYHINRFLEKFPDVHDYDSIRKAIFKYFSEKVAPATRNTRLKYLRAFFSWCVSQGYLPANPTEGIKKAKEDINNIRHISLEEVKKLLEQPNKKSYAGLRDYCLMLVQIDTGARPGELFQVKVSDLNLESREIRIRPEVAKTRAGRTLIITPFTVQQLARFLKLRPDWWDDDVPLFATENGLPLCRQHWDRRMRDYCKKAGVKVTPYGLRHTFAIEFLKAGGDPFSLQRILGHADLTMTRRYVRLSQDDIREVHEKASPVQKLQQMGKRAPRKLV
ncbi:MAG: tyrosine-type recombinase/integrase [Thermosediminibacteraceae bacterium]|nr:tyrosine-type recombinase/integrase [Thermosediminibacteraceae bacterium]